MQTKATKKKKQTMISSVPSRHETLGGAWGSFVFLYFFIKVGMDEAKKIFFIFIFCKFFYFYIFIFCKFFCMKEKVFYSGSAGSATLFSSSDDSVSSGAASHSKSSRSPTQAAVVHRSRTYSR